MSKSLFGLAVVLTVSVLGSATDARLGSANAQGVQDGVLIETIPGHYRYENGTRVGGVIVTDEGVIVIDGLSSEAMGHHVQEQIAEEIGLPVRYLISSTFHNNYTRGNAAYDDVIKIGHEYYKEDLQALLTEDNVPAAEQAARLPHLTYRENMSLHLGGKEIQIIHVGPAHTRGDSVVFVPEDRIVYVSELLFYDRFPWMNSGYIAWIEAIDTVLAMDADIFVPGQGPMVFDEPDDTRQAFIRMRQVLVDARDAVQAEIDRGASEDQAVANVMLSQYRDLSAYERQREVVVRQTYQDLTDTRE